MCGIAGFLSERENFTKNDLEKMTDVLAHRGPNASGYYYDYNIGLGHRRLSILDLSTSANQPMKSQCGRYVIVFNGEIYNFQEIAKDLDVELKTTSDTEVLIEAFVKWGADFVNKLNGMFAFAIYDTQEKRCYLFRDRMGIKPLYYYYQDGVLAFGSELKSLIQLDKLKNGGVDRNALTDFLYLGYIPTPNSIYKNIKKFPSGSYAIVGEGQFQIHSFWKLENQVEPKVISNFDEAKKELKKLLISSVKYRMISDVPFGTFLSGGIDSSLVTAIAQSLSDKPVKTFSIGFEEAKFNESKYARSVAEHLGTDHNEKVLSYKNAFDLLETVFDLYDEPFSDSSAFPTLLVSEFAKEKVSVILSGDGGDESYFGYGFYNWGNRLKNPMVSMMRKPIAMALKYGDSRLKRASHLFEYQNENRLKSHIFSQEQYCFSENELSEILRPDFKASISLDEAINVPQRNLSFNEEQALFDMKYYLQDDLFVKVDRSSMKHSLEVRVPLMDHRLATFALNLSEDLRKKEGVTKYLLKEVLYEYLPKEFFDRPKWGFGIPLVNWLRTEWSFLMDDYLNEEAINKTAVFNYKFVNQYVERFKNGEDYLYNRLWLMILTQRHLE